MGFRLVLKSVTLNDLSGYFCVISANSIAFGAHCVKVVDDIPKRSTRPKCSPEFLVFSDISLTMT